MSEIVQEVAAEVTETDAERYMREREEALVAQAEEVPEPEAVEEIPEPPKELLDYLEEPQLEEVAPEAEPPDPEDEFDFSDPDTAKLKKSLEAAEKRTKWLEAKRIEDNTPRWAAEATKYWRYADTDSINASSRKDFLRQAKAQHERLAPKINELLEPERQRLAQEIEARKAELEQEAKDQWGIAVSGPGVSSSEAAEREGRLVRQRQATRAPAGRALTDLVKARLTKGELGNIGDLAKGEE